MDTKEIVDNYFNTQTKDLKKYFNKFANSYEKQFFPEMLSELYIHIIQNIVKLDNIIKEGKLHYYCVQFIYNQRNWSGTVFKKMITNKESNDELFFG